MSPSRKPLEAGPDVVTAASRVWTVIAVAYVVLVTLALTFFITRVPIQLTDGASNMISVIDYRPWQLFVDKATNSAFFRPLMWPPYVLVMDWSQGAYFAWFKSIHALQVLVLLLLLLRFVRVRTAVDAVSLSFAVAVLVGGHTFAGLVREAYPINHFLAIAISVLAAATLAAEPHHRIVNDVLALLLFVYAALTLETGLLVWVALVWAYLLGWRGVSWPTVALVTMAVIGYGYIRFVLLDTGTPTLLERGSGFGFATFSNVELQSRFGANPLPFFAYNVVSAVSSVLFAEPRAGVFVFVRALVRDDWQPWIVVNVCCATGATLLIGVSAWHRRRSWLSRGLLHADRVVLMFPVLLFANAAFCYVYLKDVVLSTAGVFLAAATFVAMRDAIERIQRSRRVWPALAASVVLGLLSAGWAVKQIGVHYSVRQQSINERRGWAAVDQWLAQQEAVLDTPAKRALKAALEDEAIAGSPPPPFPPMPWPHSWFDETQ
ncbi:MAG: hypothetical protein ABL971_01235 [Vicinamibacterales bacterium]